MRLAASLLLLAPGLVVFAVGILLPLGEMIAQSLQGVKGPFAPYVDLFRTPTVLRVWGETALVSGLVATLTGLIATCCVWAIVLGAPLTARFVIFLALAPAWTSLVVRAFSFLLLLQDTGMISWLAGLVGCDLDSLAYNKGAVVVGTAYALLPLNVLLLLGTQTTFRREQLSHVELLGATPLEAVCRVFLVALARPAFLSAGAVFAVASGYFVTPAILGGGREVVLGMLLEMKVNRLLDLASAGALSTMMILFSLPLAFLCVRFLRFERA